MCCLLCRLGWVDAAGYLLPQSRRAAPCCIPLFPVATKLHSDALNGLAVGDGGITGRLLAIMRRYASVTSMATWTGSD